MRKDKWPKLDTPARVGNAEYGVGVSSRLVVERAQREYQWYKDEVRISKERIREAEVARRKLWDKINGPITADEMR